MARSKEYWNKRFETLEEAQIKKGADYYAELEKQYRKAENAIQKDIDRWFARFAENNELTLQGARKLLNNNELEEFKWSVLDYIEKGRTLNISDQWAKQLENASAKFHITRLEAIKLQMQNHVEMLYGNEEDEFAETMKRIYTDGYYHTAYEIQKGFNIGYDLMRLDTNKVEKVLAKPWAADGSNFSDRIWKQKNQLVSELHNGLTQAIIRGQHPSVVTDMIAKRFSVSKGQAGRLVMTESAFFASASNRDCYKDLGIEQYEVLATLDKKTSEICRDLDGKVFKMSEYQVGVTAPPFHVWCRTTTVPYFDDEFELGSERAARNEDGKTYYVPSDMKYRDWEKAFVDGGSKKDLTPLENTVKNSTMKLGAGSSSIKGKTQRYELGQINVEDTEIVANELSEQIRHSNVENAIVIDKNGNVVHFQSTEQDAVLVFDVDLDGATVTHNHPVSNGIVSFGEDDFLFLRDNQKIKSLRCCNSKYDYFVEVLEDISELSYNDLWLQAIEVFDQYDDDDIQHIVFEVLNKKGYVKYERKSI